MRGKNKADRLAADLLPINWDNTTVGKQTAGKNDLRINKIMALGYQYKASHQNIASFQSATMRGKNKADRQSVFSPHP